MFKNIGTTEVLIIAVVIVLLFGGRKIPEFVRSLGQSVKEFKKAVKEDESKPKDDQK
jgi:sec-independent protein translocase protein TatA